MDMAKPKIRFNGYTEDWEQRKFGELYEKVNEKNDLSFGADKIISVANMYFKEEVKESNDDYMRTYNVMRLGDIAFEGNKSKNFSHGRFVENTIGDGIVSHVFDVFRPVMNYDLLFWKYLINNENVMGRIMTRCTKASTMMTNLVAKDFLNEDILIPTIEEQSKIGECIDKIDHLITLHQRKCEQTKTLKKYMLQKMFPQDGEKVPQIRFEGFTEDWEQRKLGDLTKELSDYATMASGLPLLTSSRSGLMYQSDFRDRKTTTSDETLFSIVPKGSCTYRHMSDDDIFHLNINVLEKGLVSREYPVFISSEDNDLEFIIQHINSSDRFRGFCKGQKKGGTRTRLYYKTLCEFEMMTPLIEEQKKISATLHNLDHLITLHQRKCDELKEVKKFMLQNMFV